MNRWEQRRDGRVMMWGPEESFPSREQRDQMIKAGYKIYVDGKIFKQGSAKKA